MIGEIGGSAEEEAAAFIKSYVTKPVVAYIAGMTAPKASVWDTQERLSAVEKERQKIKLLHLKAAGVKTMRSLAEIGSALRELLK